jgi:hypothetical protein
MVRPARDERAPRRAWGALAPRPQGLFVTAGRVPGDAFPVFNRTSEKTETSMAPPAGREPTWTTRRPSAIAAGDDGVKLLLDRRQTPRGRPAHMPEAWTEQVGLEPTIFRSNARSRHVQKGKAQSEWPTS